MISQLAQKITNKLFPNIVTEDAELCVYFFFILFSKWLSFIEVIIFGFILRNVREAILFYFVFTPLREYSGGIHARKEMTCIFCTALALFLSITGIKFMEATVGCAIQAVFLIIGTVVIFLLSPLDTPEKPLDARENMVFGLKSKCICIAENLIAIGAYLLGFAKITNTISMGIALESILLISGKVQRNILLRIQATNSIF